MNFATLDVDLRKRFGTRGDSSFQLETRFEVLPGVTILLGQSGAGKTTLLRCIAGLCDPDYGRIAIGERVLFDAGRKISIGLPHRRMGFVFQDLALFPHLTVQDNIGYGLRRLHSVERQRRTDTILESFQIAHLRKRLPREISGGEQQRVALARSLVIEPSALLLDEPLSSLDVLTKSGIIEDLRAWNEGRRIPVLYVTHDYSEVFALGDRALALCDGRIVAQGSPLDVVPAMRRETLAQFAGFENVFDATVVGLQAHEGIMTCRLDGTSIQLAAPLTRVSVGSAVRVGILAGDILLASAPPDLLSPCNVIHGRIKCVARAGATVEATVDCGVELRVHLDPGSVGSSRLQRGAEAWLIIKTDACHFIRKDRRTRLQRLFVFVCSGNTSRSPMAQAICNAEIARRLKVPLESLSAFGVQAISAGLSAKPGAPMTTEAQRALAHLGVTAFEHRAQNLNAELAAKAEAIFCMTQKQYESIVAAFPEAAAKTCCLQPDTDIEDPTGHGAEAFLRLARQFQSLIRQRMDALLGVAEVPLYAASSSSTT